MPKLVNKVHKFLINNLSGEQIQHTAEQFSTGLNLKQYAGVSYGVDLTKKAAANAIISYLEDDDRVLDYVTYVMHLDGKTGGGIGRIKLKNPHRFIREMNNFGWQYNDKANRFERDQSRVKTSDFGILRSGSTYVLAFMSIDIVGSSNLKQEVEVSTLNEMYRKYRSFASKLVHQFGGRIWDWSGDGFIAAFYGDQEVFNALRAARYMHSEVVRFQFDFNKLAPDQPIRLRTGLDYGEVEFRRSGNLARQTHPRNADRIQSDFCEADNVVATQTFQSQLPYSYQNLFQRTGDTIDYEPLMVFRMN